MEKRLTEETGITPEFQLINSIDWENPVKLDTMTGKSKFALQYDLRLRECLHIAKENTGPGHGLNEDWGATFTHVHGTLFSKRCINSGTGDQGFLPSISLYVSPIFSLFLGFFGPISPHCHP